MGAGHLTEPPVLLDVVFDSFPASIRGALVVRGGDPNPHQATVEEAVVADLRTPTRGAGEVGITGATVHVRPRGEVVIPFEVQLADLPPGWYLVSVTVSVDGQQRITFAEPTRRFLAAWPREMVRRGPLEVDLPIEVPGTAGARIQRLECKGDRAVVRWTSTEADALGDIRVTADGKPLPTLDAGKGEEERATTVYPVLKSHGSLSFSFDKRMAGDGSADRGPWTVDFPLP